MTTLSEHIRKFNLASLKFHNAFFKEKKKKETKAGETKATIRTLPTEHQRKTYFRDLAKSATTIAKFLKEEKIDHRESELDELGEIIGSINSDLHSLSSMLERSELNELGGKIDNLEDIINHLHPDYQSEPSSDSESEPDSPRPR